MLTIAMRLLCQEVWSGKAPTVIDVYTEGTFLITGNGAKAGVSVKRRLGPGVGVGMSFFFQIFFAIYLQIDSFWWKKYLLVYNGKSFYM